MVKYRDLITALRRLDLDPSRPVIAHASLSAFGHVQGGAETLLGALLSTIDSLVMPAFTYKTMLVPEAGPLGNAMVYGSGGDRNRLVEFFRLEMPVDRLIGTVAETLRRHPNAHRSMHPILSFCGVNAERVLDCQTLEEPLAPIRVLAELDGSVLLMGVDHTVNTSIHLGERLAGRRHFIRWALTPAGVVECPSFPGCSDGFNLLAGRLEGSSRFAQVGPARLQAIPLRSLIDTARAWVAAEPLALLCDRSYCDRCQETRNGQEKRGNGDSVRGL